MASTNILKWLRRLYLKQPRMESRPFNETLEHVVFLQYDHQLDVMVLHRKITLKLYVWHRVRSSNFPGYFTMVMQVNIFMNVTSIHIRFSSPFYQHKITIFSVLEERVSYYTGRKNSISTSLLHKVRKEHMLV